MGEVIDELEGRHQLYLQWWDLASVITIGVNHSGNDRCWSL